MADTVGECPECGKNTFILHRTVIDGNKGVMGKCYSCGHEQWMDEGPIHQPRPQPQEDIWDRASRYFWG
jgi:hypothetical protein